MSKLTFHQGVSLGGQVVTLDGEDISSALRALSVQVVAWEAPVVTIQPGVYEFNTEPSEIELGLGATKVHIAKETVELLKRFGWTPPVEEI